MTKIPVNDVWPNIVEYYYAHIQPNDSKYSIWQWVESEYGGRRRWNGHINRSAGHDEYDFIFEDDADATAFKIKFMSYAVA